MSRLALILAALLALCIAAIGLLPHIIIALIILNT